MKYEAEMNQKHNNRDKYQDGDQLIQDTVEQLKPYFKQTQKYCYYPSAGNNLRPTLNLDAQAFFFSDQIHFDLKNILMRKIPDIKVFVDTDHFFVFETQGKRGYYIFLENNVALEVIRKLTTKLDYFVGVRDGCEEGGNFECTNVPPFLEKIINFCSPEGMSIILDHSDFLDRNPEFIFGENYIKFENNLTEVFNHDPIEETRLYSVTKHKPMVHEWKRSNIRLTIEFDNILNHVDELDGVIGSCAFRHRAKENGVFESRKFSIQMGYFFRPEEKSGWSADQSLERILEILEKRNWRKVGVTAFGQKGHQNFLDILTHYEPKNPIWLRFFHVEKDDFHDLIKMMKQ